MKSNVKMSTIKLFKAIPIETKKKKIASKSLLKQTIELGFIFSPYVIYNYTEKELLNLIKIIKSEVGLSSEQMNKSFHKTWAKIKNASMEQLVLEQIIHYITTYGFESLGIYDKNSVYIPNEKLEIPELKLDKIVLTIINGYTAKELKKKVLDMLGSGIALKSDTIEAIVDIAKNVKLTPSEVENIKNREVKIALYNEFNIVPSEPVEFLRYVVYVLTGSTLLIKDYKTLEAIKVTEYKKLSQHFNYYKKHFGLGKLAEIFYRFKPLFLAMRSDKKNKPIINKIRRLAVKYHVPTQEDYLNSITARIGKLEKIDKEILNKKLDKTTVFRKIRLAYALKFRTNDIDSILYRIRNGKSFAKSFVFTQKSEAKRVLNIVLNSIIKDISKNVKGKKIYIPKNIKYTLPATEKQFTGYLPSGTCVSVNRDMIFGVHWNDVGNQRIDLDLSLLNISVGKIGWDSDYRSDDGNILFSGDVTAAPLPLGASELFYVRRQVKDAFLLSVNYYNHYENENIDVPFKIIVAKEQVSNLKNNYMVNPNNVVSIAKSVINQKQKILGLLVTTTSQCRFYFTETYLGNSITSSDNEFAEHARKYLLSFYENTISLNNVLMEAGAKLVDNVDKCDIDLSSEALEKDTILNLLKK